MVEKSEFRGDVGQAVVGDVNEGPRNSNVVNLTIGAKSEFKALTKLQRQDITDKVKALVALGDSKSLEIYRVLLNHFGAANMDAFPGDKYREAMALLDDRMNAPHKAAPAAAAPTHSDTERAALPCGTCSQYAAQIKRTRLTMRLQWLLLLGALLFCGWLWRPSPVDAAPDSSPEARCFVDGKAYSIGSSSKMPNGSIRECAQNGPGEVPRWVIGARR